MRGSLAGQVHLWLPALLVCLLAACQSQRPKEPPRIQDGWIVCDEISIGKDGSIHDVRIRKDNDFGSEIIFRGGVKTCRKEGLPERLAHMLDSADAAGIPPESGIPVEVFEMYARLKPGWSYDDLVKGIGAPHAGRPVYDIERGCPIVEYYWECPKEGGAWLLTAYVSDSKGLVGKSLVQSSWYSQMAHESWRPDESNTAAFTELVPASSPMKHAECSMASLTTAARPP